MEILFEEPEWQEVSPQAVDLLKNMLKVNPAERFSIEQVCCHAWLAQEDTQ